jgi:MarR family transcriptional regulator, temperature-dependent positive regulator of motility
MTSETQRQPGAESLSFQGSTAHLLAMVGALCSQRWVAMLGQFDVSRSQYKVVMCLAELGPLGQRHLADLIGIDPRNCVPVIDSLAERGLVARETDPSDRRRRVLGLTGTGRRLALELRAVSGQIEAEVLQPLDPAGQALLRRMLVAMLDHARD